MTKWIMLALCCALNGCVVVSTVTTVADVAVDVTVGAVKTTANVVGAVIP